MSSPLEVDHKHNCSVLKASLLLFCAFIFMLYIHVIGCNVYNACTNSKNTHALSNHTVQSTLRTCQGTVYKKIISLISNGNC